ncbi:MAG TPA: ATP-binding cassette domain-containing protein, partial [Blastocatellia bacterium]|nr:ATP-binding cassette domain-containing protein [Blastocatellia bacterium]
NVALPLLLEGGDERHSHARAAELLDRVGLGGRALHFPAALSGGEMQRAAVARAVIARPGMVLADEPTGNLDSEAGQQVMELLAELNRELQVTILLATHSEEAARYARRTISIRDGSIERDIPGYSRDESILGSV